MLLVWCPHIGLHLQLGTKGPHFRHGSLKLHVYLVSDVFKYSVT